MRQLLSSTNNILSRGDKLFGSVVKGAAAFFAALLAAVVVFLIVLSVPAFTATGADASLLTGSFWGYVLPLAFGTVWVSILALAMALPVAVFVAIFLTHYAPRRLTGLFGGLVEMLAAVPSVVFGLWGITVLAPAVQPLYEWLANNLGLIPFFAGPASATGRTIFTAAIVLAIMILPIITSLSRELFLRTPKLFEEGVLALGATKWEMIRTSVLGSSRAGIVSASMLGLGRALGETMAVTMVLSATGGISWKLLTAENPSTIAANIALTFPEAYQTNINVLIATGLVLFVITLGVSALARFTVRRFSVSG